MIQKILKDIDNSKDEVIAGLEQLIALPSSDLQATNAQTFVEDMLKSLDFDVHTFKGIHENVYSLSDYCPLEQPFHEDAYNVVGTYKSNSNHPSLLLFAHIDTEAEDYFGTFEKPYASYHEDGKIYGLGSSDDKGGIAMMLYALHFLKKHVKEFPYDLTVMSILGKHGGAAGTLSALMHGYSADYGIYLHPAETGHGFAEIKNISLGVLDLDLEVTGKCGKKHDDLDTGCNANVLLAHIITWLEEYNQMMRSKYVFDFGSFKGEPSFVLNIGTIESNNGYGGIAQKASLKLRIRFYKPLTLEDVYSDVLNFLSLKIKETGLMEQSQLDVKQGNFRANPAIVETDHPFVQFVRKNIKEITGIEEFIHQYHGGSDIRLPILYGNCACIGIGPSCDLPNKNSQQQEWISVEDYITGIKILTKVLYEFNKTSF